MTYDELLNKFKDTFPFVEIDDYRPVCHELFEKGKVGITIWLKNGDMVVYYPKFERQKAEQQLKPCPFCGTEAGMRETVFGYSVKCCNDQCYVKPIGDFANTKQKAIEKWNRRAKG